MRTAELEKAREAHDRLVHSLKESRAKIARLRWLPWADKDLAVEQANEKQLMDRMNVQQWLQQAQETATGSRSVRSKCWRQRLLRFLCSPFLPRNRGVRHASFSSYQPAQGNLKA